MAEQHSAPDPTSVTDEYVVTVQGPPEVTSSLAERYGKWLVFRDVQLLDETWHVIEKAVQSGELGAMEASCSTRKYNPTEAGPGSKQSGVIRVFTTEDTMDEVGFRLAQLVKHDISYKTEEATRKGMYIHSGAKKTTLKTIYWNSGAPSFILTGKTFSWKVATHPESTEGGDRGYRGLMRDFWSQNIARAPIDPDGASEKINGKWVLHVDHGKMSDVWHIIKDEIESGKLSALEAECPSLSSGRGGHRGSPRGRGGHSGRGRGWGRTGRTADGKRAPSQGEVSQKAEIPDGQAQVEGQEERGEEGAKLQEELQPPDLQQKASKSENTTEEGSADVVEHKEPQKKGESEEAHEYQPKTVTASEGRSEEEGSAEHSCVRQTPAESHGLEPADEMTEIEQHQQRGQVEVQTEVVPGEDKLDETDRPHVEEGEVIGAADTMRAPGGRKGESEAIGRDQNSEALEDQHEHPKREEEGSSRMPEDEEQEKRDGVGHDGAGPQDYATQQRGHLEKGDKDIGRGDHEQMGMNDAQGDGGDERGHGPREVCFARAQEENRDEGQHEGRPQGPREYHHQGRQPGQWRSPHKESGMGHWEKRDDSRWRTSEKRERQGQWRAPHQGSGKGHWEKRRGDDRWGTREEQGPWRRSQPGKRQTPSGRDQGDYVGGAHQQEQRKHREDRGDGRPKAAIVVYTSSTKMEEVGRRLIELVEGNIYYETRETAMPDGRLVPSRQRVLRWNDGKPVLDPTTQL